MLLKVIVVVLLAGLTGCAEEPRIEPSAAQYPSPMEEGTRAHERVSEQSHAGLSFVLEEVLPRPVEVFVPERWQGAEMLDLLVHFHGAAYVVREAVTRIDRPFALAVVNLGSGSSVYERPFQDNLAFSSLLSAIDRMLEPRLANLYLSSWSAGYGAVRAILKSDFDGIQGILLLDGLHTDYVPDRMTLFEGGTLNTLKLEGFLSFAREAIAGRKSMVITHSEIFPGTYASTTETATWIIREAGITRAPVLRWGPRGMQLLSEATEGRLYILGFAGNASPDHIDHYHGMPTFLSALLAN